MNNSIRTVSKIKSSFFLATAIIQSISGILLLRQAIVRKNGFLNFPAIALLYDCGRNILNLVSELKAQRAIKELSPPETKPTSTN